jgi:plastocyanin
LLTAGASLTLGLVSCTPPDADVVETPEAAAVTSPEASAPEAAQSVAPPEVVIEAADFSYAAPDEVPAGMTQVTLKNGGKELHQAGLYQLTGGKAFEDFAAATAGDAEAPLPEWVVPAGGPNATIPGASSSSFVDLQPGYYVMLCGIPNAEGVPHFKLGQIRPLRVGAAAEVEAEAPAADTTITGADFAFTVASPMTAGDHVISFVNNGTQGHEATLFMLEEGAKAADIAAAFAPGGSGQPPAKPIGGVVTVAPKSAQSFPTTLTPGRYALICFLPDANTGKVHAELGMMAEFDVQ